MPLDDTPPPASRPHPVLQQMHQRAIAARDSAGEALAKLTITSPSVFGNEAVYAYVVLIFAGEAMTMHFLADAIAAIDSTTRGMPPTVKGGDAPG